MDGGRGKKDKKNLATFSACRSQPFAWITSLWFWAVCCVAVRNCLECRQRQRDRGGKSAHGGSKPVDAPQGGTAATAAKVSQPCPSGMQFTLFVYTCRHRAPGVAWLKTEGSEVGRPQVPGLASPLHSCVTRLLSLSWDLRFWFLMEILITCTS